MFQKITSRESYEQYIQKYAHPRKELEKAIARKNKEHSLWLQDGYCEVCDSLTQFRLSWKYSYNNLPNYRDSLRCSNCMLNNRQRFIYQYARNIIRDNNYKSIYCYEQVTGFYKKFKQEYEELVVGSEYLGSDLHPGRIYDGLRHEDAGNLSFDDETIDLIISNDVFEHVQDLNRALQEAYRVLKKGGQLIIAVPFKFNLEQTRKRAELVDGKYIHYLPEEYHGNPLSENGSLVFTDLGWDFLDFSKDIGFLDTSMICYYDYVLGYIGDGMQYIFHFKK
ncbi:class I SAM-dependent methyltransferase [Psychrobacillus sp. NPDC096623]|uniref:class I SAM-dependent methyltransferase n=1 Tax=Psychrobacillus sp. NPDC096623 TaxID=3364492 RepID=UPI0037FA95D0